MGAEFAVGQAYASDHAIAERAGLLKPDDGELPDGEPQDEGKQA
jgi:hypothetical protein